MDDQPTQPLPESPLEETEPTTEPTFELFDQSATAPAPADRRRRESGVHPVNVLHLVMGVAFLGITVIWALVEWGAAGASDLRWLLPIPFVAAGVAGLVATAPRLRGPRV